MYRQTSDISLTLLGNKLVHHSDVGGASPVGAAPTTSSFSTLHLASMNNGQSQLQGRGETIECWYLVRLILDV